MEDDKPLLIDTGRGFTVKYKGKFLYSSYAPLENTLKQVTSFSCIDRTLVFVPSFGLGYGLAELLGRTGDKVHGLCVEADKTWMDFVKDQARARGPDHPRFTLMVS
jgi:hypothetical protein